MRRMRDCAAPKSAASRLANATRPGKLDAYSVSTTRVLVSVDHCSVFKVLLTHVVVAPTNNWSLHVGYARSYGTACGMHYLACGKFRTFCRREGVLILDN